MYGISRSLALSVPVGVGALALLHSLDASRPLAIAVLSVVMAASSLLAAILQDRHENAELRS
jgi:hypothetical protein